jgi:hypothetical protein
MSRPPQKNWFRGEGKPDEGQPAAPPHRSAGEEVDAILQTARDAAARLTEAVREEAERTRAEANAAATREVEQARQHAEVEREEAAKERADAQAYVARLRNEAEVAAETLRAEAEREAAALVDTARVRVDALEAQARRSEQRLQQLVEVVRGMSLEIEEVLEEEAEASLELEPADQDPAVDAAPQDLGEALRPNSRSEVSHTT